MTNAVTWFTGTAASDYLLDTAADRRSFRLVLLSEAEQCSETSQINDDFDPTGLDRHHIKRHSTTGLDAYPAFGNACGHQTIRYILRPRLGESMIERDRSCIGGGEAEHSYGC